MMTASIASDSASPGLLRAGPGEIGIGAEAAPTPTAVESSRSLPLTHKKARPPLRHWNPFPRVAAPQEAEGAVTRGWQAPRISRLMCQPALAGLHAGHRHAHRALRAFKAIMTIP